MVVCDTTILENPHVYTWFTLAEYGALPNEVAKHRGVCKNIAQSPFWFGAICPWTDSLLFLDTPLECSSSSSKLSFCKDKHLCILGMSPETIDRSVVSHTHIHLACQVREIYASTITAKSIQTSWTHNSYWHKRLTHPHKHRICKQVSVPREPSQTLQRKWRSVSWKIDLCPSISSPASATIIFSSAGSRTKCGRYVDRDWLHTSILGIQSFWNECFAPPLPWLNGSKQWQRKGATKKSWTYASCWTNFNRDGASIVPLRNSTQLQKHIQESTSVPACKRDMPKGLKVWLLIDLIYHCIICVMRKYLDLQAGQVACSWTS